MTLRKTLNVSADLVRNIVIPALPQLVSINEQFRKDDVGDDIASLYAAVNLGVDSQLTQFELERLAQSISLETSTWNKQQIHRVFRQALGINLIGADPWLAGMLGTFAINNANLIKNVSTTFVNQTQQLVMEGMVKGWRHEVIAKKLLGTGKDELGKVSRFHMAKTRADLIARDQINKLNGNLTHLRQTDAGVTHYFWRDSNDVRVRQSHAGFNGNRFSWKMGAPGGIHPGDEIQCRCWAQPDFETIKI